MGLFDMGLFERALNYFLRLAKPAPEVRYGPGVDAEEARERPRGKRARLKRALRRGHSRVMKRIRQPKRQPPTQP